MAGGMNLQLRKNGFSYDTYTCDPHVTGELASRAGIKGSPASRSPTHLQFHRVDVDLEGAAGNPVILPDNPTPIVTNYYTQLNSGRPVSPKAYGRVTYRNIYPFIDLVFQVTRSGSKGSPGVEYFFILRPGANPASILLHYKGALKTELRQDSLFIIVTKGQFRENIPCSYLGNLIANNASPSVQQSVAVHYRQLAPDIYGFTTAEYDRKKTLIIDPTPNLTWGTYYGGNDNDNASGLAKDATGNIYFAGAQASQNPVCSGIPVTFTASASGVTGTPSYQWELNGSPVSTTDSVYTSGALADSDQLNCILTISNSVCSYAPFHSDTIQEIVFPTPLIFITGDSLLAPGQQTQLFAAAQPGNISSYSWSPDTAINDPSSQNPMIGPLTNNTVYTLTVTSTDGCTAVKNIELFATVNISIPNAFTPNHDGKNNVFKAIYGSNIDHVDFKVYNRWGGLIFEDTGTHQGWDGTFGNTPQPPGTYAWVFQYTTASGQAKVLTGTVILIR
jgi:gliding motility-associated-like protein